MWTGKISVGHEPNSSITKNEYMPDKETTTQKGMFITGVTASY